MKTSHPFPVGTLVECIRPNQAMLHRGYLVGSKFLVTEAYTEGDEDYIRVVPIRGSEDYLFGYMSLYTNRFVLPRDKHKASLEDLI